MLSNEDETFLTEFHRAMDQLEVAPDDPRFVNLSEYKGAVGGPDVTLELVRAVTRGGPTSSVYFAGLRGSGKSTQLLRAKKVLEEQGFAVLRLDAEDYLNVRTPLGPPELLFALAGGIEEQAREAGFLSKDGASWHDHIIKWARGLPSRVDVAGGLSIGFPDVLGASPSFKVSLRSDDTFVAAMREFFSERLAGLVTEANDYVESLTQRIKDFWTNRDLKWIGLVVIFDSLDHARGRQGDEEDFRAIREAMESLFTVHAGLTRMSGCRLVYCLPPYVRVGDGVVRSLASVKVTDKDGAPADGGRQALTEVLRRRTPNADLGRLLGSSDLDRLIGLSGGNFRDLMRLVQEVGIKADQLPASSAVVDGAIETFKSQIRRNLADDEKALLKRVHETHQADLATQDEWARLSPLFDRYLILAYRNGEDWYDVHPLVVDLIE
ncbi:MAG: hypothetical protein ACSLFB_00470 [Acidimicrobiales bacterium]